MYFVVFVASFCNLSTKRRTKKTEKIEWPCKEGRNPTARMADHSSITYEDGSLYAREAAFYDQPAKCRR